MKIRKLMMKHNTTKVSWNSHNISRRNWFSFEKWNIKIFLRKVDIFIEMKLKKESSLKETNFAIGLSIKNMSYTLKFSSLCFVIFSKRPRQSLLSRTCSLCLLHALFYSTLCVWLDIKIYHILLYIKNSFNKIECQNIESSNNEKIL